MINRIQATKKKFGLLVTCLAVVICLAVLVAVPHASAEENEPTVYIESYTVTPSVLAPGDYGTITVVIRNTATTASVQESTGSTSGGGVETVRNVDIPVQIDAIVLEENGITSLSESYRRFGSLGPGQSTTVSFAIKAPSKEGIYFPEVWVDINGGKSVRYPILVNVNAQNQVLRAPTLVVGKSLPYSINPGDEFLVALNIKNEGVLRAGQIVMTVNTSSTSIGVKGSNTVTLHDIEGGGSKNLSIDFLTDRDTPTGLQRINLGFDYQLPDGSFKHQDEIVEVYVKGKAELGFVSVDTSPARLTAGTPFDLTIRIENTGTGEARQVSATVDLPANGVREAFIGKIKPGNDAPAVFLLEGTGGGNHPYNFTVNYTDDMGTHTLTRQMNLRVPPTDITGTIILVVIVLIIIGFVGYRYWYLPKVNGDGTFPWERKS